MPDYIDLQLTADTEELRQDGRDWLLAQAPEGYTIDPWVDWLLSAVARMAVEVVVLTSRVPTEIYRRFVQTVLGIPALEATSAVAAVQFTLADTAGHTIPEGTQISVDGIGFETNTDLVVASGASTGQVQVTAMTPGSAGTGLSGAAELVAPTFVWVDSVTLIGVSGGGTDGETPDEYVNRVADELPTLSPKAILIEDFEALARRDLEVQRALALDNFVPPATTGVAGAVTVAVQNAEGQPVSSAALARVEQVLEGSRVLNLDVHVINPTYTTIDVAFTIDVLPGYDEASVVADAEAELADFLSPARWGTPAGGDERGWIDEEIVRRLDLIGALYRVSGVRHVTVLTLAENPDALATSDVALDAPAGLPLPGTITGTAS